MNNIKNKGKTFARVEVSEKQKEYIALLAELRGVPTTELLQQVIERFIDSNLQLIDDYRNSLDDLKQKCGRRMTMKI